MTLSILSIPNMPILSENVYMLDFGTRLKTFIESHGVKAHTVAMELGIDPALMNKIINGKRKPSPEFLEALMPSRLVTFDLTTLQGWRLADEYSKEVIVKALSEIEALNELKTRPMEDIKKVIEPELKRRLKKGETN